MALVAKSAVLATRRSPLALVQAELAASCLRAGGWTVELLEMTTTGDRRTSWSLEERGGKGLFTKELEEALLDGRADLAVHSAKDLPTEEVPGLTLAGFLPRAPVRDVLVTSEGVEALRTIATGSPRRRSQAKALYPQACWTEIRGNVETRLRKIVERLADATILAEAGLLRLGLKSYEGLRMAPLSIEDMVPAAGQGAIALQCRVDEAGRFSGLLCADTHLAVTAERHFLGLLGGGCHTAAGVHYADGVLHAYHEDFGRVTGNLRLREAGEVPEKLGRFMAKHLEGRL